VPVLKGFLLGAMTGSLSAPLYDLRRIFALFPHVGMTSLSITSAHFYSGTVFIKFIQCILPRFIFLEFVDLDLLD